MSFFSNKNILITGATGFLGSHIFFKLYEEGANVICTTHDSKPFNYLTAGNTKDINVLSLDINNLSRIREIISDYEIDYIFHCSAKAIVKNCVNDPITCFKTNIIGTANILEASRQVGGVKGIMVMESDKSYGSFDDSDLPYREDQGIKPKNIYEVSKACAGLIAESYAHNFNIPVFTIRAANLYGPGDINTSRLIPGSILRLLTGRSPILYSGVANYIREFLYVEDAARAIIMLMKNIDITKSEIINLGSGTTMKIAEVIEHITKNIDKNIAPVIIEKDASFIEIEKQYLDLSKMKKLLPKFSHTSFESGVKNTIEWYGRYKDNIASPKDFK